MGDHGGYRLCFTRAEHAERAYERAAGWAQETADSMRVWGEPSWAGAWARNLVRDGSSLVVDPDSEIHCLEYRIERTRQAETLFQKTCMRLAFFEPQASFSGECSYHTDETFEWVFGTQSESFSATQTIKASYDCERLTFDITFSAEEDHGRDRATQRQVWERNEYGFFWCKSLQVPWFTADADPVDLRKLAHAQVGNPYLDSTGFFVCLCRMLDQEERPSAYPMPEGCSWGATMVEDPKRGPLPAVCLYDPRDRELWVACSPEGARTHELPRWVEASPEGDILAWQVADGLYFWDGLRVRRCFL